MPHLTIEHSANVFINLDGVSFMKELHTAISKYDSFKLNEIKSRCIRHETFLVGEGAPKAAFVYLRMDLLPGRDPAIKTALCGEFVEIISRALDGSPIKSNTDISVELREMDRAFYLKGKVPDFAKSQ